MEQKHKDILKRRRIYLAEDLEPSKLWNRLDVLDDDDREEIKTKETRSEQAFALLDMLIRKGPNAFSNFVSTLHELKSQKHLADLLINDSGIQISTIPKGDTGMTRQHKEILRNSVKSLHHLDLNKMVAQLSDLLDEHDKQNLLNATKPALQRVEMLLTEVLPRRGPTAFESFVQGLEKVDPPMAQRFLQSAGMKGSPDGERSATKLPVQDTGSYSLDAPVQDILDERPELLKKFRDLMDKEDVWGNGWKRFYQELGLPAGKETAMEGKDGGPTLNVIMGWISFEGRGATVQALLSAVNRSRRKDCSYCLEKSLGCVLDCVDSPIVTEDVTKKMGAVTLSSREAREVKFFGDLYDNEASLVSSKLGQDAEKLLRNALGKDSSKSTKELIRLSVNYPIRTYTDQVPKEYRERTIKALREALSYKGVTGPLLPPNTFVREVGYTYRRNLTRNLCDKDHWKLLAERLGMDNTSINFLDSRRVENPADEVLRFWEVKAKSTVGALYDILVDIGCPFIADLL